MIYFQTYEMGLSTAGLHDIKNTSNRPRDEGRSDERGAGSGSIRPTKWRTRQKENISCSPSFGDK